MWTQSAGITMLFLFKDEKEAHTFLFLVSSLLLGLPCTGNRWKPRHSSYQRSMTGCLS